jgi:hypothetical protein
VFSMKFWGREIRGAVGGGWMEFVGLAVCVAADLGVRLRGSESRGGGLELHGGFGYT